MGTTKKKETVAEKIMEILIILGFNTLVHAYGYTVSVIGEDSKNDTRSHLVHITRTKAIDEPDNSKSQKEIIEKNRADNKKFRFLLGITRSETSLVCKLDTKEGYNVFQHKVVLGFKRGETESIDDYVERVGLAVGSTVLEAGTEWE